MGKKRKLARRKKRKLERKEKDDKIMWSQFPIEILITILMGTDLVDCIRASTVCVSWRAALTEIVARNLHPPLYQLPWLIVSQENEIYRALNLSDNNVYDLHLSQAFGASCLGSFDGWLILKDKRPNGCFLLNVTSKECIRLPHSANVWNSARHRHRYVEHFWKCDVGTGAIAILSSDPTSGDCTVVIDWSEKTLAWNTLAFCRVGDAAWTAWEEKSKQFRYICDIKFYNGHIHIASFGNLLTIYDYELGPCPNSTKWKTLPAPEIEYSFEDMFFYPLVYLVESCGDLLMVVRLYDERGTFNTAFRIFKMDTSGSHWIKVESLGDQMLFLGYSKSLSAKGLLGFKGNCIYFTHNADTDPDSGVFDLGDGSIKLFPSSISYLIPYEPMWVTPYPM